jgi:hypothetical protein
MLYFFLIENFIGLSGIRLQQIFGLVGEEIAALGTDSEEGAIVEQMEAGEDVLRFSEFTYEDGLAGF